MEINVKLEAMDKIVRVVLRGRMDVAGVQSVEDEFNRQIAQAGHPVLLDMAGVEFLGSMGIRLMLAGAKALKQRGLKMVLFDPPALVEDTWYSAGLADIMPVEHDYTNALAICKGK